MTTTTLTLTDFLLARIAEDEAQAAKHQQAASRHGFGDYTHRVLIEAASKRELVALADPYDFADDGGTGMSEHADKILRLLAQPYADHPDYREEWRV